MKKIACGFLLLQLTFSFGALAADAIQGDGSAPLNRGGQSNSGSGVFNVKDFGAKAMARRTTGRRFNRPLTQRKLLEAARSYYHIRRLYIGSMLRCW
jgi:hypothetical protein